MLTRTNSQCVKGKSKPMVSNNQNPKYRRPEPIFKQSIASHPNLVPTMRVDKQKEISWSDGIDNSKYQVQRFPPTFGGGGTPTSLRGGEKKNEGKKWKIHESQRIELQLAQK